MTDEEAAEIQGRWAWISRDLLPDASQAKADIRALLDERTALAAIAQAVTARFHEYGQCPLCDGTLAHTADCPIMRYRQSVDE